MLLVQVEAADAEHELLAGRLDAVLLRPPVDRDLLHAIVLYEEESVVVVSRDHVLAALDDDEVVDGTDLADEVLLRPADDVVPWAGTPGAQAGAPAAPGRAPREVPPTTGDAIALVAAGVGVTVVPRSLARLHHRRDVTARALADAPTSPVALAWSIERADDRTEDLVGIVRGRTVNSSRGRPQPAPASPKQPAAERRAARGTGKRGAKPQGRAGRRRR
ncbi:LysR substrate-binding domain-containing protein [Pseudactinotalea suaedae]